MIIDATIEYCSITHFIGGKCAVVARGEPYARTTPTTMAARRAESEACEHAIYGWWYVIGEGTATADTHLKARLDVLWIKALRPFNSGQYHA